MIKFLLSYFFIILFIFNSFAQGRDKKVIARISDREITLPEFEERYDQFLLTTGIKDKITFRDAILNSMIGEIILTSFDNNEKIYSHPDYKNEIEWIKKQTILAYLKDQDIYAKIRVSDKEIRQTFLNVNEKITARHLYAPTEKEAYTLYNLLNSGKDFNTLARNVFTDTLLQNNGGYLDYFTWGDMDPAFEDAAYSLKVGEISAPVKTAYGYSIIKLEDRISSPLLTEYEYQKKKSHLERVLRIRKKEPAEKQYLSKIINIKDVLYNAKSLLNILDNLSLGKYTEVNKKESEPICVTYKGKRFSEQEIEKRLFGIPFYHRKKIKSVESLKSAVIGLMLQEKLLSSAYKKKYDTIPVVIETVDKLSKKTFLQYKYLEILSNYNLPDSTVKNYYYENVDLFTSSNEINVQEIILDKKSIADSVKQLYLSGGDFGKLAEIFSLRKWSAKNKGIMGYADITKYGMLKDTLWKVPINKVIGPLRVDNYYGIFRVLGKTEGKPIDYLSIKDEVSKAAKNELQKEIVNEYITHLSEKLNIKIDKDVFASSFNEEFNNTPK
jgi:parvulin-like peptidyl-prolyl isomerase